LAVLFGLALAGGLAGAVVVARLAGEGRGLALAVDPRLVDLASLLLNVVLVVTLVRFGGLRRGSG